MPDELVPTLMTAERVDDVLLTALALALAPRRHRLGTVVTWERHGRHEFAGVDLSRTVGWFTSLVPVRLDLADTDPTGALETVSRRLRSLGDGLGFGILRHTAADLAGLPAPRVAFNYLGRVRTGTGPWTVAPEPTRLPGGDPGQPLPHVLTVDALTADTPDGPTLTVHFGRPAALLSDREVVEVADAWLRALTDLVRRADVPHRSADTVPWVDADEFADLFDTDEELSW
ncbi:MAG: hypothetical protein HOV94_37740 [Saccharothrix sp.]|nr:hypothetical protein [Saccharothrix sp.]